MLHDNYAAANKAEVLSRAMGLMKELRYTLDLIRAGTPREELVEAVGAARAPLAALQDELGDSIAYSAGWRLSAIAEDIEAKAKREGEILGDAVHGLHMLRLNFEEYDPRGLDRDYRMLASAWEASNNPEQLQNRLDEAQLGTELGGAVARILVGRYDEAKAHLS